MAFLSFSSPSLALLPLLLFLCGVRENFDVSVATVVATAPLTRPSQPAGRPPILSSRLKGYEDDIDSFSLSSSSSPSYFERNGLRPPPLISRRRRAQEADGEGQTAGGEPDADGETSAVGNSHSVGSPTSSASISEGDELESIVLDARLGLDANARLRNDLIFSEQSNYDKHSYPYEYVWFNDTAEELTGVPVEVNINFHKVLKVDTVDSYMDLIVWFRLVWVDPRLTWRPEEYGGITKTTFWIGDGGAGGESSEIWT